MLIDEFTQEIVRNFLVKDLYHIQTVSNSEPENLKNSFLDYKAMHELSIESYQKNLIGEWTLIELLGTKNTIHDCFITTAKSIKEIWQQNYPCNILYTNADTLCVHPLDIFGKFSEFRMFTEEDPLFFTDDPKEWYKRDANAGVRYYPYSLNDNFWEEFDLVIENWNYHFNYDQGAANILMLGQQNFDWDKKQGWVVKQIGAQHFKLLEDLNNSKFDHAILHFHSSQNPKFRLECMQNLWGNLND